MDLGLKGKVVLVTAASKGLGKATAKEFASEGAYVLISSRNKDELEKVKQEICLETGNDHINYAVCDITNPKDIYHLLEMAVELYGTVDVLVNNAGGPRAGSFDDVDDSAWQEAFELNLLSYVRMIRAVLPHMRNRGGGHIVNLASSSIKQPIDNLILSNTLRTGIVGLSKSLAQELAKDNILINTVGPGRIATDRIEQLDKAKAQRLNLLYEDVKLESELSIPLGRYGRPDEFAKMVVYLCSGANTYITGQAFLVDGGMVKAL